MNMVEITHPEATVASIELGVSQEVYEVYLDAIASPYGVEPIEKDRTTFMFLKIFFAGLLI